MALWRYKESCIYGIHLRTAWTGITGYFTALDLGTPQTCHSDLREAADGLRTKLILFVSCALLSIRPGDRRCRGSHAGPLAEIIRVQVVRLIFRTEYDGCSASSFIAAGPLTMAEPGQRGSVQYGVHARLLPARAYCGIHCLPNAGTY